MGVIALFARMWTYHLPYDDLLAIIAMVALFRVATDPGNPLSQKYFAGSILSVLAVLNLARLSDISPLRYSILIRANQITWIVMLLFLIFFIRAEAQTGRTEKQSLYG